MQAGVDFKAEEMVLWLDASIIVVCKPAGLPALPDGYDPDAPYLKSVLAPVFGPLWMLHRLDRDTSGILVLARTPEAHRAINTQFEQRQVEKLYHALVVGVPDWEEKIVNLRLRPNGDRKHRTVVDARQGKPSVTNLSVLERFRDRSLLEARPQTGRTHQIRAHLAAVGYPILADGLYGDGSGLFLSQLKPAYRAGRSDELPLLDRLALHARRLSFVHPMSGESLQIEAPYPKDFQAALRNLRKYSQPA
jgi:tRNA pseudouridine32 synthase/23S rRNA pseudouridine746 synthase